MKWPISLSRIIYFKIIFLLIEVTFSYRAYSKQITGIDSMPLLGAGIKFNLTKPSLKTCLANSKEYSVKKEINTEIQYLDNKQNHNFEDYEIELFVKKNLELLKKKEKRLKKEKVSSFLIVIDIDKNIEFKSLDKLSFQKDIERVLSEKNYDLFFQECGDYFIEAVKKRSRLLLFASFYGTRIKDRKVLKKTIKKRITYDTKDSFQLNLFKDFEYNSFFHLDVLQKGVNQYVDILYGVDKWKGKSLDYYIKTILKKSLNTQDGYLVNFQKRKWSDLPTLLKIYNENDLPKKSKSLQLDSRKFLQRIQNDLFLFKSKKAIAKKKGNKLCFAKAKALEESLNWETFSDCKKKLLLHPLGNTSMIKECHALKNQLMVFFKERNCKNIRSKNPLLSPFIYQERTLNLTGPNPKNIQMGFGTDTNGKVYRNCLRDIELPYIPKTNNNNYAENRYSPLKRGVFFAKLNSSLTISETSQRALSRFNLSKNLIDKIETNLPQFFKECGTHFISSIKFKKGYNLDLKISHFRAFRKKVFLDDENDLPSLTSSMELFRKQDVKEEGRVKRLFSKRKKKRRARWLKKIKVNFSTIGIKNKNFNPKNLEEFLRNLQSFKKSLSNEKGTPIKVTLTPWSDVIIWNNILKSRDLDFFDQLML